VTSLSTCAISASSGFSIRKIICMLRPLQSVTIRLARQQVTAKPEHTDDARHALDALTHQNGPIQIGCALRQAHW